MTNREIANSSRFRHQGSALLCYTIKTINGKETVAPVLEQKDTFDGKLISGEYVWEENGMEISVTVSFRARCSYDSAAEVLSMVTFSDLSEYLK